VHLHRRAGVRHVRGVRPNRAANFRGPPILASLQLCVLKYSKTHLQQTRISKIFRGQTPEPPLLDPPLNTMYRAANCLTPALLHPAVAHHTAPYRPTLSPALHPLAAPMQSNGLGRQSVDQFLVRCNLKIAFTHVFSDVGALRSVRLSTQSEAVPSISFLVSVIFSER